MTNWDIFVGDLLAKIKINHSQTKEKSVF